MRARDVISTRYVLPATMHMDSTFHRKYCSVYLRHKYQCFQISGFPLLRRFCFSFLFSFSFSLGFSLGLSFVSLPLALSTFFALSFLCLFAGETEGGCDPPRSAATTASSWDSDSDSDSDSELDSLLGCTTRGDALTAVKPSLAGVLFVLVIKGVSVGLLDVLGASVSSDFPTFAPS